MAFGENKIQAALPYPEFELPEDLVEQARLFYEYVFSRAELVKQSIVGKKAKNLVEVFAERKVNPELYTQRDDSYGTVDATIVAPDFLEIIDLKTGGVLVEADASQLKLYALGMMAAHADPLSGLTPFKTIQLTVFQPKRPGEMEIARSVTYTPDDLINWALEVWIPAATASDDPNAKATVTVEGCKYCKCAKAKSCPEYIASVQKTAAMLFTPVVPIGSPQFQDPMQTTFNVDSLSLEQLGAFLELWPLLKARAKDIEDRAMAILMARQPVPGVKLVKGRGTKKWALDDEAQAKKFRNMKLTLKEVYAQKLRSPAQMLALPIPTKKKEAIKKHIITKAGALTVVPDNDLRVDAMLSVEFNPVKPEEQAIAPALPDFLSL
jgi:hypothetical protein